MAMTVSKLQTLRNELRGLAKRFALERCCDVVAIGITFHGANKATLATIEHLPQIKARVCGSAPNGKEETHEYDELTLVEEFGSVFVELTAFSPERPKVAITGIDLTDTCHEFAQAVFAETTDSLNSAEVPDEEAAEKLAAVARTFLSRLDGGS